MAHGQERQSRPVLGISFLSVPELSLCAPHFTQPCTRHWGWTQFHSTNELRGVM